MEEKIRALEEGFRSQDGEQAFPEFRAGDRVRVHERVTERKQEGKERIQVFDGVVLQVRGKGISKTFTIRKESFGVGVEKIFPLYSPKIARIEVVERRKVRQSRPFYLRRERLR